MAARTLPRLVERGRLDPTQGDVVFCESLETWEMGGFCWTQWSLQFFLADLPFNQKVREHPGTNFQLTELNISGGLQKDVFLNVDDTSSW